ncbi:MAG: DUF5320 domain-containing protein [Candidatus Uhrbacteria bacterium]
MPNLDGTGPQGKGPRTGRGLGKCEDVKFKDDRGPGRGVGQGSGRGRNSQSRAKISGNR